MTNRNPALTAANIRYLLVIRELDTEKRGARCIDVAKALGVTKPDRNYRRLLPGRDSQEHLQNV